MKRSWLVVNDLLVKMENGEIRHFANVPAAPGLQWMVGNPGSTT
jgi:hypothetical protein